MDEEEKKQLELALKDAFVIIQLLIEQSQGYVKISRSQIESFSAKKIIRNDDPESGGIELKVV